MTGPPRYRMRCPSCHHKTEISLPMDIIAKLLTCEACSYQWLALDEQRSAIERIDDSEVWR